MSWQVMILTISKYYAAQEATEIGMMAESSGLEYVGDLVAGSWNKLTGGMEAGEAAAGAAIGRKAIVQGLMAARGAGLPGAIMSTLALGGFSAVAAADEISQDNAEFARVLLDEGGLNPALEQLAAGSISAQRQMLEDKQDRLSAMEALWILASPILTFILFFAGYRMMAGLGVGQAASQAGQSIGGGIASTLGSRGISTRIGGGK